MTALDWRSHATGPMQPCRLCGRPAMMRDAFGAPCHMTCAEDLEPFSAASAADPIDVERLARAVDLAATRGRARRPARRPAATPTGDATITSLFATT